MDGWFLLSLHHSEHQTALDGVLSRHIRSCIAWHYIGIAYRREGGWLFALPWNSHGDGHGHGYQTHAGTAQTCADRRFEKMGYGLDGLFFPFVISFYPAFFSCFLSKQMGAGESRRNTVTASGLGNMDMDMVNRAHWTCSAFALFFPWFLV